MLDSDFKGYTFYLTVSFIGEDTYEGQITNPLSLNLYTYVLNNPLRYYDPTGFWNEELGVNWTLNEYKWAWASASSKAEKSKIAAEAEAIRTQLYEVGYSKKDIIQSTDPAVSEDIVMDKAYESTSQLMSNFASEMAFEAATIVTLGEAAPIFLTQRPSVNLAFSQKSASPMFSNEGSFSGKSIGQVASELRSGSIKIDSVPVQVVVRENTALIVNTRSSLALTRAGIPTSKWNIVDLTGNEQAETAMTARLLYNKLSNSGTDSLYITGSGFGKNASNLK